MISTLLILVMICTLCFSKKGFLSDIVTFGAEYFRVREKKIYFGINAILAIFIIHIPDFYIWVYMRERGFISYEVFLHEKIITLLSIESIGIIIILCFYLVLPFLLDKLLPKKKENNSKCTSIFPWLMLVALLCMFAYLIYDIEYWSFRLFIISLILLILKNFIPYKHHLRTILCIITLSILIVIPIKTENELTKFILFRSDIGNIKVLVEQKNYQEWHCLLLRTNEFYYLKDKFDNIRIVKTGNIILTYPKNKNECITND